MTTCIDSAWLEAHPEFNVAEAIKHPIDRAHPYPPGSGPRGQTCGTCAKLCTRRYAKTYFKCRVLMKFWTGGRKTDIRKKDPACLCWEPRIDKIEVVTTADRANGGRFPQLRPDSPMRRRLRTAASTQFKDETKARTPAA